MRTRLISVCGLPVQWCVSASFKRSLNDQTLRYGSHVTSGTAGGRNGAACASVEMRSTNGSAFLFMLLSTNHRKAGDSQPRCPHRDQLDGFQRLGRLDGARLKRVEKIVLVG